jgi:hypothetical protein
MSSSSQRTDKTIETQGFWIFGGLSVLLTLGKATGLWEWSWWRVALPFLSFLVFNVPYIAMGFLYLSVVSVRQRPQEEESHLLRTQTATVYYWAGFLFVSGFTLNVVSRLEPGKASMGWWLFSGRLEVLAAFAAFSVVSLWVYWSRIGHLLNDTDDLLC